MEQKTKQNKMQEIEIEKVVLSVRGIKEELEKGVKLLQKVSGKKPATKQSHKRIPAFSVRPGLEIGAIVTVRGKEAEKMLEKFLAAIENVLRAKQITDNHFSFGIPEYIEIPGEEYDRDIGMRGFGVTVVFTRKGKRIEKKKIKRSKKPLRQNVSKAEIIKFMEDNFGTEIE